MRPKPSLPLHALFREATSNALAGRQLVVLVVILIAGLVAGVALWDMRITAQVIEQEAQFRLAGGYLLRAETRDDAGRPVELIDRRLCERLAASPAISRAGSLGAGGEIRPVSKPGEVLGVFGGSHGLALLIEEHETGSTEPTTATPPAVLISPDLARRLGLADGMFLDPMGDAPQMAVGVGNVGLLGEGLGGAVLTVVAPEGTASACFVAPRASAVSAVADALPAVLGGGPRITVQRVVRGAESLPSRADAHAGRISQWGWLSVVAAAALGWRSVVFVRRSDLALYQTLGASPSEVRTMLAAEALIIVGLGGALGLLVIAPLGLIAFGGNVPPAAARVGLASGLAAVFGATAAAVLVSLLLPRASLLELLKDR